MDNKKMTSITMVETKKLRPHPKNPRKNLGDLTELTESIKANGIMQNLTAVPDPDKEDGYMIIIGHRRFAAGKKAGLKKFPVSVVLLDEADQVKLMLCENIQRSDLTPVEQAEGFQMMIDFGITVDDLSKDTGFAPSTIYHRLNIAKLDKELVSKKLDQLTLTDLIELEKIEDIDVRNEILKKSNRQTFAQAVQSAVNDQKTKKNEEAFVERLKAAGLTERAGRSWDADVGDFTNIYISAGNDGSDVEVEKYEHFNRSEYGPSYLIYAMKVPSAEEDEEKAKLEEKIQDIRHIIGDAKEELDAIVLDIQEEAQAFAESVAGGQYIKEKRDEFLTECFILDIIGAGDFTISGTDAFEPDLFGIDSSWCYEGTTQEWRSEMENAVRKKYGNDPTVYATFTLTDNMRIFPARGYADAVMRGIQRFYENDEAQILDRIIKALELIGFNLNDEYKKYLTEDNEIVKRVEKAKSDYEKLKGGSK